MDHLQAKLLHNRPELQDYRVLELHAPEIAAKAKPGQFAHVRVGSGLDPLLRRPFSVMLPNRHEGTIQLLIKNVGRGTDLLCHLREGVLVDVLGPLGSSFTPPPPGRDILMVAGGVGVAPLVYFADVLQTDPTAHYRVRGLYGGRNSDQLPLWTEFGGRCEEFYVATEDGSAGEQGLVTDLLEGQLQRGDVQVVYTCGPRAMMAKVAAMSAVAGVTCFVSMEQWMGCGLGACMGCVVPAVAGGYVRVCVDGPVFDAATLDWDSM
ncbi:dihydroorotate dehydrogenase electron transfer subunit [bacterium]|nr:dihydroorotate dehydrogenase electron transfer subunit [bacterium]